MTRSVRAVSTSRLITYYSPYPETGNPSPPYPARKSRSIDYTSPNGPAPSSSETRRTPEPLRSGHPSRIERRYSLPNLSTQTHGIARSAHLQRYHRKPQRRPVYLYRMSDDTDDNVRYDKNVRNMKNRSFSVILPCQSCRSCPKSISSVVQKTA